MSGDISYTVSSGNVFADLGFPEPEEELAKAELVFRISRIIGDRGWGGSRAAAELGIDEPTLAALLDGRLDQFTTGRLRQFLRPADAAP